MTENTFWTALATSSLAGLVTSLGIYTIRRFSDWGHRNTTYFMCFAAGVLISASFLHIMPRSFSMNPQAPIWLLVDGGFAIDAWGQTLAVAPGEMREIDPLRPGRGECPFVVAASSPRSG